jgi:hypothetical protein
MADRRSKMPVAQQGEFIALSTSFSSAIAEVEDSLNQTKNRRGQDPLNYPIRLNNRIGALMGVVSSSGGRPTQQSYQVYTVLSVELTRELTKLKKLREANLPKLNALLRAAGLKQIDATGPIS